MIDQPVVRHVRTVPISVESHTFVTRMGGCRTEVRRFSITTPMITLLEAIGVTSNQKAGVKRLITGQQLVGVSCVSSHAVPQSISTSSLPIVSCGRYGQVGLSFEVGLVSSMVINEDDFCKLRHSRDIVKLAELKFGAFQISLGSYGKTRMRKYCSGVEPSQSLFESCLISGA